MTIKVGDKIPSATLMEMQDGKPTPVPTDSFFAGKKVALFALPGAWILMRATRGRGGMGEAAAIPLALLVVAALQLAALPAQSWMIHGVIQLMSLKLKLKVNSAYVIPR